ncbi:MAG TPA: hypothetical protein VJX28_02480 [Chthoniobacterales bacterium]|nr:hypothetical protein [Chthoniobacterales bacterium]
MFVLCWSYFLQLRQLPASPAEDYPFGKVEQAIQDRTRNIVHWEKDQTTRAQTLEEVRRLLRSPLTMNAAVQIALLNNQSLQATFEEVGLSAADLQEAGTIPNPRFDLSARFPDKPPSGADVALRNSASALRAASTISPVARLVAKLPPRLLFVSR